MCASLKETHDGSHNTKLYGCYSMNIYVLVSCPIINYMIVRQEIHITNYQRYLLKGIYGDSS